MNRNVLNKLPIGLISLCILIIAGMAASGTDPMAGLFILFGLCFSGIIFVLYCALIRSIFDRFGFKESTGEVVMLISVVALSLYVATGQVRQGRNSLRHGLGGQTPHNLKIVDYQGKSGLFVEHCRMGIRCDPGSLRDIITSAPFQRVNESFYAQNSQPVLKGFDGIEIDRSEWMEFKRGNGPRCSVITDGSYSWARVYYSAGD